MKRSVVGFILVLVLSAGLQSMAYASVLKVGATPVPHAEILEVVVPILAEQDITLEIIEFNDYVQPNLALQNGELDANFFQHQPYLDSFNEDARSDLVSLTGVHIEPLGIYSQKIEHLSELKRRAQIAIPNDVTNGGRALLLLQEAGLITVDPKSGLTPTIFDITENDLQLRFFELESAQLSRALPDVDAAIINGNYALLAGFVPTSDSLFLEGAESPYVNILAVQSQELDNEDLQKLAGALTSDAVKQFLEEKYEGSVVPAF